MTEAVRVAEDSARDAGAERIVGVRLRVGTLSGAVPEAMEFAWDVVRKDTLAEQAWLKIDTVPASCWCERCDAEFPTSDFLVECPECHEMSNDLRRGRELEIASLELI